MMTRGEPSRPSTAARAPVGVEEHDRCSGCGEVAYKRKIEVALRLLRGEPANDVARELGVAETLITSWKADFVAAMDSGSDVPPRAILWRAVRRFRITPRELEVLELALDGQAAAEIAASLCVSVSTVVGHLTRLRIKTRTHSSSAMIARVLGW